MNITQWYAQVCIGYLPVWEVAPPHCWWHPVEDGPVEEGVGKVANITSMRVRTKHHLVQLVLDVLDGFLDGCEFLVEDIAEYARDDAFDVSTALGCHDVKQAELLVAR